MLGGTKGLGPAWTRGEMERPLGEEERDGCTFGVYTPEQQARLGVDKYGEKRRPPAPVPKLRLRPPPASHAWVASKIDGVLYDEIDLMRMVKDLGARLNRDYEGKEVVIVGLLTGVFMFMSDLVRQLNVKDHYIDFMAASSYGRKTISSGNVKILKDLNAPIEGKHVVLVDEMCDTGRTMACVRKLLMDRGAASVKTCVLLNKAARRAVEITPDYIGGECPDEFVVGYGMDFREQYRSLPFVATLSRSEYE
jgi:hypoxanthine phosphoribosyltransferase